MKNNSGTNYINAVYINDYQNKSNYIATQVPLEFTLGEYWQMISECNIKAIAWLHGTNEARTFPIFFPTASFPIDEAEIKVKLLYETQLGDIIKKTILLVQDEVTFCERNHFIVRLMPGLRRFKFAPKQFNKSSAKSGSIIK